MRVLFSPEARSEFEQAEAHYQRQQVGLDERFRAEVRSALHRIGAWPLSCPREQGDIRRLVLPRFPYKVLYSVESDHLYVIAVAHQHREPSYWVGRMSQR